MRKIRVLIVDDAATVRRLLIEALSDDPQLEVVGTAANGRLALAGLPQTRPDLMILDVQMPVMDGLETLVELRKFHPRLPVIIFSSVTRHGAEATLNALWLGANDYVTKTSARSTSAAIMHVRAELIPRIKALCAEVLDRPAPEAGLTPAGTLVPRLAIVRARSSRVEVLAIGSSTGGPGALAAILHELPPDFPVPVLVVQHMPPLFTSLLAERLASKTSLRVEEGANGVVIEPGGVWLAPGNFHMTLERVGIEVRIRLDRSPPENSCRPSVDPLFRSVAEIYGPSALVAVLTGMGHDGLRGCERIARAGGQILVQDESSSVVWGMPGNVAKAGLADRVVPLSEFAGEILRRVSTGRGRRSAA